MRLELNRRKFLKLAGMTALAASATALTGCGGGGNTPSTPDTPKPSEPDKPSEPEKPDYPIIDSDPEETDGVVWIYQQTGAATATLLGFRNAGVIPSGNVILPSVINELEITQIGTTAFRGQAWTSVEIPETVQVIGEGAFLNCSSLASVSLYNGLKASRRMLSSTLL